MPNRKSRVIPLVVLLLALAVYQTSAPADRFAGSKAGDQRVIAGIRLCWCAS